MSDFDYASAETTDFTSIPIIDMPDLDADTGLNSPEFFIFAQALMSAATEVGFFYLRNHGVPENLREQAMAASRRFFALPEDIKQKIAVNSDQRGWMAKGGAVLQGAETFDAKEIFFWGWESEQMDTSLPLVAPNQWPDDEAAFLKAEIMAYYTAVLGLSKVVLAGLAAGLGKPADFFTPFYLNPLGRGQLVYYPPSTSADRAARRFGAAAHADFGVLTILFQDNLGGLQVRNRSGDWIEAPPVDNSFVCNIGDMLSYWTGGRLASTIHRVINRTDQARFSIPIFCDPSSDTVIDPGVFAESAKAECGPAVQAGQFIQSRNQRNFTHYQKA